VRAYLARALPGLDAGAVLSAAVQSAASAGGGAAALSAALVEDALARLRAEVGDGASTLFCGAGDAAGSVTSRMPADPGAGTFKHARAGEGAAMEVEEGVQPPPAAASSSSAAAAFSASTSAAVAAPAAAGSAGASSSAAAAAAAAASFVSRDDLARQEESAGMLQFRVIRNDGVRQHMIWLTQVKNIFATQLPKMPREYISRLVFDRKHRSLLAIKKDRVVGGICFRPFVPQVRARGLGQGCGCPAL
jgi:hypothetical protein